MIVKPSFQSWNCTGQRIFLRADLNVPLMHNIIISDHRLRAIQPTLDYILKKNAQVILASHIGRPNGYDAALSTKQLIPWFKQNGYTIVFADSIKAVQAQPFEPGTIILFENVRFFPGEKQADNAFAMQLASLAPWYINDAFGTLHRTDTSVTLLAQLYPRDRRSIGFLIEKELTILAHLKHNPAHPVCFIIGGNKVADKLPFIEHLFSFADTIVLCPALVFTFLKALNKPTGLAPIDENSLAYIPQLLQKAQQTQTTIIFPRDYQVARGTIKGPLTYVDADKILNNSFGISIGPKTLAHLQDIITTSSTVFYNGMMGFADRPETLQGIQAILRYMAESLAITVVAGGDSVAIVDQLKLQGITHCMTGGGSTLAYLGNQELPGLQPFLKDGTKTN